MDPVSLVTTLLVIALIGFLVYLIITYLPMPEPFKQVIIVVCVIFIILYVLYLISGSHAAILRR